MATVFKRAKDTKNALEDWMNQQPQSNSSAYESALNEALDMLTESGSFAGNYTAGTDQNARNYLSGYRAAVNQAAADSAAQTKALSGGYGADYADSAAAQAAQLQSQWARSAEPMFRSMASSAYNANTASDQAAVAGMLTGQQLENSADQLNYQNWAAMRDVLAGQANAAAADQTDFWSRLWNGVLWLAQSGLNAYDAYKGFTQQQWENDFLLQQWQAQQAQQQLENERYNTEYADSRADAAWQQSMTEQQWAAQQQAAADDHALSQLQMEQIRQQMALDAAAQAAGLSWGSGGGLSYSEWLQGMGQLDNALLMDSPLTGHYAESLGIDLNSTGGAAGRMGTTADLSSEVSLARSFVNQGYTGEEITNYFYERNYSKEQIAMILSQVR